MRVFDAMSWDLNRHELKSYLGLNGDPSEDVKLQLWLESAIEAADLYIDKDFILTRSRFLIASGVGAGDQFTVEITPDDESKQTATYTALTGDTREIVASNLREDLSDLLEDDYDFEVSGGGAVIWVYSGDPDVAFMADATYTPSLGTSGMTTTRFYTEIPEGVKIGVYEYVKALREVFRRAVGLKSVKTGQLAETYDAGGMDPNDVAFSAGRGWWRRWKKDRLLDGGTD